jgi:hypothetical protein
MLVPEPKTMHRTQLLLEPEQYRHLGDEARRRGISLAALIRGLIDDHLGRSQQPEEEDPLEGLVGIGEGSGEAVGQAHDRYLYRPGDA